MLRSAGTRVASPGLTLLRHFSATGVHEAEAELRWPPSTEDLSPELQRLLRADSAGPSGASETVQAPTPDAVRVSVLQLMKERSVPRLAASSRSALLQLKVTDLRAELQKWGLSSEGRKEVLADKLLQELLPARSTAQTSADTDMEKQRRPVGTLPVAYTNSEQLPKVTEMLREAKLDDVRVMDVRESSAFTNSMVFGTGRSQRHIEAAANGLVYRMQQICAHVFPGQRPAVEGGTEGADWLVVDAGDIVVHILTEEARKEYDLEGFWREAHQMTAAT